MVKRILTCPDPAKWLRRIANSITQDGDCWRWTGKINTTGYGRFHVYSRGKTTLTGAHRASWLAHRGDIPTDLMLDHLCRNRWCVNPWHLELVTAQINILRGDHSLKAKRSCVKHGRDDGYFYTRPKGHLEWVCRICRRINEARYDHR